MYILTTTERACANLAASASLSASLDVTIYCGLDSEEKIAPAVVITADSATEEFPNSGVWHVKTGLTVKEIAADSSFSSSLASTIFESFLNDTAKGTLNMYPGYFVHDFFVEDTSNTQEGDAWIQTVRLDIVCALK